MGNFDDKRIASIWEEAKLSNCQMQLKPLDEMPRLRYAAEVLSELSHTVVRQAAIAPELVQLLDDRAAGNPKHIKEMIKVGGAGEDGGHLRITGCCSCSISFSKLLSLFPFL